jgi:hypothetical protein
MSQDAENRANNVSREVVFQLTQIGAGTLDWSEELYNSIPEALTVDEVITLGGRVSDLTELVYPSRDALSRGAKNRLRMVAKIGSMGVIRGDEATAKSSAEFLRARPSVSSHLAAFMIKRQLTKKNKANNPLQTP